MTNDQIPDVEAAVARIDALLEELNSRLDPRARAKAEELVQALMEVYGAGLRRVTEIVREAGEAAVLDRFAEDKLLASLLLLHGLHPVDAETRVRRALMSIERKLGSARVQFLGISEGVAGIRVEGGRNGIAGVIEQAVQAAAPEIDGVRFEGLEPTGHPGSLVQIMPGAL